MSIPDTEPITYVHFSRDFDAKKGAVEHERSSALVFFVGSFNNVMEMCIKCSKCIRRIFDLLCSIWNWIHAIWNYSWFLRCFNYVLRIIDWLL